MELTEILRIANEIAGEYGLRAEFLGEDIFSVGVQGDKRTYTPILVLVGPNPGWEIVARISTTISNRTSINRVTLDITPMEKEKL